MLTVRMSTESEDDIAIVGQACNFPGAPNLDEYWRVLVNGENHLKEIPKDRWDNDAFYDADKNAKGKSYVNKAAFIDNYKNWDNKFFGINDDEAKRMDPQQHLLLECVYTALEDGGFPLTSLDGVDVGCFIGLMNCDYAEIANSDIAAASNYTVTGNSQCIAANRISYTFNFTGPSLIFDTACSSSLVALHFACQSLRSGDCSMAVCGGVNFLISPDVFVILSRARMLSPDGQCKPFSADGNGYARGEGCGIVILKPFAKALKDGDKIWGVIRGTGCNQDGHFAVPITAPSSRQQESLLRRVYSKYNIDPSEISYIEAHGTGTVVGDPAEAASLGNIIGKARHEGQKCYIGSVKGNIGHLESAAGVAGLIKVLLMMQHNTLVPSLHSERLNSNIPFSKLQLALPSQTMPWPTLPNASRLACVNSFGFGGTNAHVIIRQHETAENGLDLKHQSPSENSNHIVVVSAKSKDSLRSILRDMVLVLRERQRKLQLSDIAYTSTLRRTHFAYRQAVHAYDTTDLIKKLEVAASGEIPIPVDTITTNNVVTFIFCGMGTCWDGMETDLIRTQPVFKNAFEEIDRALYDHTGWSLMEKLQLQGASSNSVLAQLGLFAMQIALAKLWASFGVVPDCIIGHSVGEVAAAHVSGKLSLKDAVAVIYHRSNLLENVKGGKMLVLSKISLETVNSLCQSTAGRAEIAAINSSTSFTLSGDSDAIMKVHEKVKEDHGNSVFNRLLNVQTAYHSFHTDRISEEFKHLLTSLDSQLTNNSIKLVSTVTGNEAVGGDFITGDYWAKNMRQCVHFSDALKNALVADANNILIEVGPRPALRVNINEVARGASAKYTTLASIQENAAQETILDSVCRLYEHGIDINWRAISVRGKMQPVEIPRYQFNRHENFHEPDASKRYRMGLEESSAKVYQYVSRIPASDIRYTCPISKSTMPYVFDHKISGSTVVPGATYAEVALEAYLSFASHMPASRCKVSIEFVKPVVMQTPKRDLTIHLEQGRSNDEYIFSIESSETKHATGKIDIGKHTGVRRVNLSHLKRRVNRQVDAEQLYSTLEQSGFSYGPLLHTLSKVWQNGNEALSMLSIPESILKEIYTTVIHPAILDGMMQSIGIPLLLRSGGIKSKRLLPVSIGEMIVYQAMSDEVYFYVKMTKEDNYLAQFNTLVLDGDGEVIAECRDIVGKYLTEGEGKVASSLAYEIKWKPYVRPLIDMPLEGEEVTSILSKRCLVFVEEHYVTETLEKLLHNKADFIYPPAVKLTSDSEMKNFLDQKLRSFNLVNYQCILYAWSISNKTDQDCHDVYERVCRVSTSLMYLLQFLTNENARLPVAVLTMGTEYENNYERNDQWQIHQPGLLGSPIWGIIRCFLKEGTYNFIKLINLSSGTEEEVRTMLQVFLTLKDTENPEWWVSGTNVFTNSICRVHSYKDHFKTRQNTSEPAMSVKVFSKHPEDIRDIYVEQSVPINRWNNDSLINVRVKEVRLHESRFYPTTAGEMSVNFSTYWPDSDNAGYELLGIDFIGEIESPNERKDRLVQVCYPARVQSVITVPKLAIVECHRVPTWMSSKPIISLMVILWDILVNKANEFQGNRLGIWSDECNSTFTSLMMQVAEVCGYSCTILDQQHLNGNNQIDVVITPANATSDLASWLINDSKPGTAVVCIQMNNMTPSNPMISACIEVQRPDIKVIIIQPAQILQTRALLDHLPKVLTWLDTIASRHTEIKYATETLTFGDLQGKQCVQNDEVAPYCSFLKMASPGPMYPSKDQLFRSDACYLVIGGTKGLGLSLLKYMARKGAGYLAVMSRNPPPESHKAHIQEIERHVTKLIFVPADVSLENQVMAALKELRRQLKGIPLKGVFHGAVSLADGLMLQMTEKKFKIATKPKILGVMNLHKATKEDPLDYFVMHSSVTSAFGNVGQANYAAANAFLDFFAHYRRSSGLCGQSINWGLLDLGLTEGKDELKEALGSLGFIAMKEPDIISCFEYALVHDPVQIILGEFSWPTISAYLYRDSFKHIRGRFQELIKVFYEDNVKGNEEAIGQFTKSGSLQANMLDVVCKVLAIESDGVSLSSNLTRLGLNSMSAVLLQTYIYEVFGIDVPMVVLVDDSTTISTLTKNIDENPHQTPESDATIHSGDPKPLMHVSSQQKSNPPANQLEHADTEAQLEMYNGTMSSLTTKPKLHQSSTSQQTYRVEIFIDL